MASDLQSCPGIQLGASWSGLRAIPTADKATPSLPWAKHGHPSGEEAEDSTRHLTVSWCHTAAFEGLQSMGYQRTRETRELWSSLLAFSPCFSGLWRTLCGGVFVPASEMLSLSTLSCVLPWSCSAFLPKQECSPRLVSVLVTRHSSDEKPFGHGVATDRWSPATGGH